VPAIDRGKRARPPRALGKAREPAPTFAADLIDWYGHQIIGQIGDCPLERHALTGPTFCTTVAIEPFLGEP